jgi:2-polyprenyl-3-methyl-5-hydroxy-6-metoxy-1,4-benzoquinol methylase
MYQNLEQVLNIYNARASIPFDGSSCCEKIQQDVDILIRLFPQRNLRICDIGCGLGWHIGELAQCGYVDLTGIDISAESLRVASTVRRKSPTGSDNMFL